MALAPRLSLRSLLLLMSHGKPQLGSFFSSSVTATGVLPAAPGADTPPAVQPPVTTAGGPRTYREGTVLQPLHGGPRPPQAVRDVTHKPCLNAHQDLSAYPTPDHGSSCTPEPVPVKPPKGILEDPRHPVLDPGIRTRSAVTNGSCSTPEPVPVKPPKGIFEDVKHPILDPGIRTCSAVTNGSCSTPEPVPVKLPKGISEDVKHQDRDPPCRPKAVTGQSAQCSPAAPDV